MTPAVRSLLRALLRAVAGLLLITVGSGVDWGVPGVDWGVIGLGLFFLSFALED